MSVVDGQPKSVLVVDDDRSTLRLVSALVTSAGYDVREARDGQQAWEQIERSLPDLVICDWDMPGLDGIGLCRKLRARELAHYVYFLLLTAYSDSDDMIAGLAAGADDFVTKPIHRAVLLARLEAGARILDMEQKLRDASQSDPLTGLLNRRAFHQRFVQEWSRTDRAPGSALSCVMVDIDFFKQVNDTHGHAAGDMVLRHVAEILRSQCRRSDVACRYGGEEFCILLPETTESEAACWAERVRSAIARTEVQVEQAVIGVTASFGVAQRLQDVAVPERLAALADQALMTAKQAGRDSVVRFSFLHARLIELSGHQRNEGPLYGIVARDVMSAAVFCPREDDTVFQTADLFLQLRVTSAPVVDREGLIVGVVSESDLLERTALGDGWDDPIGEVMRRDVVCYDEDTPIEVIYQFLSRVSLPRIVVVQQRRPTGVISRATLLRWFRNWALRHGDLVEDHSAADVRRRRAGIIKTAQTAAARAVSLSQSVAGGPDEFVPRVIGEATRLQSLVNDLLAQCGSPRSTC